MNKLYVDYSNVYEEESKFSTIQAYTQLHYLFKYNYIPKCIPTLYLYILYRFSIIFMGMEIPPFICKRQQDHQTQKEKENKARTYYEQ